MTLEREDNSGFTPVEKLEYLSLAYQNGPKERSELIKPILEIFQVLLESRDIHDPTLKDRMSEFISQNRPSRRYRGQLDGRFAKRR